MVNKKIFFELQGHITTPALTNSESLFTISHDGRRKNYEKSTYFTNIFLDVYPCSGIQSPGSGRGR